MSHLMQPVEIEGTKYCLTENGRRTTLPRNTEILSTPTDLADLTDPSQWVCSIVGVASAFEVSFGASCVSSFDLTVSNSTASSDWYILISVAANGFILPAYENILYDPLLDGGVIGVTASDIPCGTVFTVIVTQEMGDTEDLVTTIGLAL